MGYYYLPLILAVAVLIAYFADLYSKKVNKEANEKNKEANKEQELVEKQKIKDMFLHDAKTMKYRIKNNRLDILMYDFDKPHYSSFNISKNRDLLILNNCTVSLKGTFFIGAIKNINIINDYSNFELTSKKTIDNTDYTEIHFQSNTTSFLLTSYSYSSLDNNFFKRYKNEFSESYGILINTFVKIFNDASGSFDYEDVRATEEDEQILDSLIAKVKLQWMEENKLVAEKKN